VGQQQRAPGEVPIPSTTVLIPPAGTSIHDPARYLAKLPAGRLSDALVELMEPYIPWPPGPEELDVLEQGLLLGALVWNATVEGTDLRASPELRRWADRSGMTERDRDDLRRVVEEIAARKRALFPEDRRIVADVEVVAEGGRATVLAASLSWVR
jgi:hypothetical protein